MRPAIFVTKEDDGWTYEFKGAGPLRTSLTDKVRYNLREYPNNRYDYLIHLQPFGNFSNWACSALIELPKSSVLKMLEEFNVQGRLTNISVRIHEWESAGKKDGRIYISANGELNRAGGEDE